MTTDQTDGGKPTISGLRQRQKAQQAWLNTLTRPHKRRIGVVIALGLLAGGCVIGQSALLAGILYRTIMERQPIAGAWGDIGVIVLLVLLRALLLGMAERYGMATSVMIKQALRARLLRAITTAGPDYVARTGTGRLITATYDQIEALDNYIARYLPQKSLSALLPLTIAAAIMPVNWLAGALMLLTGPLIVVLMALVGMGAADASRNQMQALERLGGYFADRLRGLETLRLFGQAEAELARVGVMAETFRQGTMKVLRMAFLSSAVLEFFSSIAIAMVAVFIGLALLGLVTLGPLNGITLYAGMFILLLAPEFYLPLRLLGQYYHDRAAAMGAADGLMALEQAAGKATDTKAIDPTTGSPTVTEPVSTTAAPPRIELKGIGLDYHSDEIAADRDRGDSTASRRPALIDLDLVLEPGQTVALIGPSGSGKTSLLKLLLGFVEPGTGTITVDARQLSRDLPADHLRRQAGWVGQKTHLFRGSIADNIALGRPAADRATIEQAAQAAGVMEFARHLPAGLDTLLGETGLGVSGGEAQRIALARAFLADRPVLLMDEPTAHLDRNTAEQVIASLRRLLPGRTVLIATHTPAVLALADRVICLDRGRLAPESRAAALLDEAVL